jgi:hypothetical protein
MSLHWCVLFASDTTDVTTAVATVATAVVAAVGLLYANRQLQESRKVACGDFLLRLDEAFQRHNAVHQFLQPAGKWGENKGGPETPEEWFLVTPYMGLFERVDILLKQGLLTIADVDSFYGYRLLNIVANGVIRKTKLETKGTAKYWKGFLHLWRALKAEHGNDWPDFREICTF